MNTLKQIEKELIADANPVRAHHALRYFKTAPGEYGYGDKFLGVSSPDIRRISKNHFKKLSLNQTINLLHETWHEARLCALFILVLKYQHGTELAKQQIVESYLKNTKFVNNWDLVDCSASKILGNWLLGKPDQSILYNFASSDLLWERRIAIISTLEFIRNIQFVHTLALAEILLGDSHDLIHKAVGWSLREVGKKDQKQLIIFLDNHAATMPRTALRYAIEKLDIRLRQHYMSLKNK